MNRIAIILVLWLVGMSSGAAQRLVVCDQWRGFGAMGLDSVSPSGVSGDAVLPLVGNSGFSFSVVVLGRASGWSFVASDSTGRRLEVGLGAEEMPDAFGGSERKSRVRAVLSGHELPTQEGGKGFPSPDARRTALTLTFDDGRWEVRADGARDAQGARFEAPGFTPAWVGIMARPEACAALERAELAETEDPFAALVRGISADSIHSRIALSVDQMEGYWSILDRSLEESMLKPGGDYRLAALADGSGVYEFLYLEGARAGSASWHPGMLKMKLTPTALPGIFDCVWYDAAGLPLHRDIKAQLGVDGRTLTISFPYQSSSLRLIREPRRAPRTT